MKKIRIKEKIIGLLAISAAFMMTVTPITVFAQGDENTEDTAVEIEEEVETFGPLTPDGNLTLVDDYGSIDLGGKQFITVVTKNGNYFYIIIDRDDQGDETVHFLNAVDEADLLSLMDDEEAKAYIESISDTDEVEIEIVEEVAEEVVEVEVVEEKNTTTEILVGILLIAIVGAGGYLYFNVYPKQKDNGKNIDQDEDYLEEEEDYLAELEEEGSENY